MTKKVYLAKSNRANPDLVSRIRQMLSKFDVEIVEYTGGAYSHNLLLSCDELIVIPDLSNININDEELWETTIGKGLFEQIIEFRKKTKEGFFIVTEFNFGEINGFFYDIGLNHRQDEDDECYIQVINGTDYVNYAEIAIQIDDFNIWEIENFIGESFDKKPSTGFISDKVLASSVTTKEEKKYLLIRKKG
jgi:hypothetical protein